MVTADSAEKIALLPVCNSRGNIRTRYFLCFNNKKSILQPFNMVGNFLRWLFTEIVFLVFNWNDYAYTYASIDEYDGKFSNSVRCV